LEAVVEQLQKMSKDQRVLSEVAGTPVSFVNKDNKIATFTKHKKRKYKDADDMLRTTETLAEELESNGLEVTNTSLSKMGFGREAQKLYFTNR
jgi:hypothetical protein